MNKDAQYLFVYGSLCKRALNSKYHFLEGSTRFISEAYLQAQLFLVEDYPGIIDSSITGELVWGELYEILDFAALFTLLDDYEACSNDYAKPHEYERVQRQVQTTSGEIYAAWVYLFLFPTDKLIHIESGNFPEFQRLAKG